MNQITFAEYFASTHCILGEGAVIERLRRSGLELDPYLVNSAFIYEDAKRAAMETICRQYLDIGRDYGLPLLLSAPTWRASRERIATAGYAGVDVNGDNFGFLDALRKSYGGYSEKVVVCGLMSCRGDAYNPGDALAVDEALEFHAWQAEKLADTGVDFLLAATLPAFSEATGLALALAATAKPYVLSFVVRPEGTMLDGTPLGYDSSPTVELTWALILASVRHIIAENLSLRSGGWQLAIGDELRGKTLGILGLGNIGSEIARVGLAFGMEVIAWSENLTPERAQAQGARLVSKDELFQHADILTIHLVLSRRTRGLVGAAELAAMKPSARLVNTSRGPIVQEAALIDALGQRKIAGAAIDVFDVEPLPLDHPYRSLENALATPYIGYVSRELFRTFYGDTVRNIAAWLDQRAKATERTSSI